MELWRACTHDGSRAFIPSILYCHIIFLSLSVSVSVSLLYFVYPSAVYLVTLWPHAAPGLI